MSRPTLATLVSATAAALIAASLTACAAATEDPDEAPAGERIGEGDEYVALGDSYTAAPLTGPMPEKDGCYRSEANYPRRIAEATGVELVDRSCGAATTEHLTQTQPTGVGSGNPPQLDGLDAGTDLVTLSIGANDFGIFGRLVLNCTRLAASDPRGDPCATADTRDGDRAVGKLLGQVEQRLVTAIEEIQDRAPDAQVLVVGYPQIVPADGTCDALPLATGDYPFAYGVNRDINGALKGAAATTGVTYIDVFAASSGHDICAADPWIAGTSPEGREAAPYHPYPEEQELVAELVLEELAE